MNKETKTNQIFVRAALMLLTMVLTSATAWADSTFSRGNGSEGSPYLIATTADLDQLAIDVNGGNTYSGKFFKMTADIAYTPETLWNDATSEERRI